MIVGRADGTIIQAPEPAVLRDRPKDGFPAGTYGPLPKEMEVKANEQLDVIPQLHSGARGPRAAYSFLAFQHGDFI